MQSRIRTGGTGPTGWLLTFLGARERGLRVRRGRAGHPAEWLLVLLEAERAEAGAQRRPDPFTRRDRAEERPADRLRARSA